MFSLFAEIKEEDGKNAAAARWEKQGGREKEAEGEEKASEKLQE